MLLLYRTIRGRPEGDVTPPERPEGQSLVANSEFRQRSLIRPRLDGLLSSCALRPGARWRCEGNAWRLAPLRPPPPEKACPTRASSGSLRACPSPARM